MSASALKRLSELNYLRNAWLEINRRTHGIRRRTAGIDRQSVADFAGNVERYLRQIQAELRSEAGYTFSPLSARFIPKPNGDERITCVPTVRDRIVQRAVSNYLTESDRCGLENNVSYGFVSGGGVHKAVRRACRLRSSRAWAYKTDITSFFDQIDREQLKRDIRRVIRTPSLYSLLDRVIDLEIDNESKERRARIRRHGIEEGVGVRQGMPLSPFLANLVLKDFDRLIERAGISMVRYADDLVMFGSSQEECERLDGLCREELVRRNHNIPEISDTGKTRIAGPTRPIDFLGVAIKKTGQGKYVAVVMQSQLDALSERILARGNIAEARKRGLTLGGLVQSLDAALAGYADAYKHCANHDQVCDHCARKKHEALSRIFASLGIDLSQLSKEQRAFLGLDGTP